MFNRNFFESGFDLIVDALNQDANSDITGDRIKLALYDRAYLLLMKPAGSGGDDLSIKLQQHTAASGGSSKALNFSRLWYKIGAPASVGQWTRVDLASPTDDLDLVSVNGVDLATDTSAAVVLVEVDANSLDGANGYKFVSNDIEGDDISNALVISTLWITQGSRYPQAIPESVLS